MYILYIIHIYTYLTIPSKNNYHNNLGLYGITQRGTVCKICKSKGQLCHMHIYRITDMSRLLQ